MSFSIFPVYFSLLVVATLKTKRTAQVLIDGAATLHIKFLKNVGRQTYCILLLALLVKNFLFPIIMNQFTCLILLFVDFFLDSFVKVILCCQWQCTNPHRHYGLGDQFTNTLCPNPTDAWYGVEGIATAANGQTVKVCRNPICCSFFKHLFPHACRNVPL